MKLCIKCNKEIDGKNYSYCKSCDVKRAVEYRQNNKEQIKEYKKEYQQNNKEKLKEYKKEYHKNNKEQILERKKEYYQDNKEQLKEYQKEYRKNNPHKAREKDRKRRALKKANVHEPYTEDQVLETYGTNCHICKEDIDLSASRSSGAPGWEQGLHLDHVIPLSKGGPDSLNNVKPAHGLCNLQKNNSLLSSR